MKKILSIVCLAIAIAITPSCKKSSDDSSSSPTNADLNGDYIGDIDIAISYKDGTNDTYNDNGVGLNASGSGSTYVLTISNPDGDDHTSTVKVSGSSFSSSTGVELFQGGVNGKIVGDKITVAFTGENTEATWTGSFVGDRPSTGGGNGGGGTFAGPADYNSGQIAVTVNGNNFILTDCSGGIYDGQLAIAGDGTTDGELELNVVGISGAGTYDINVFTWSDNRPNSLWDTVEKTVSNAVKITSITADNVVGTIDFSSDGLTIKGTFTLNK